MASSARSAAQSCTSSARSRRRRKKEAQSERTYGGENEAVTCVCAGWRNNECRCDIVFSLPPLISYFAGHPFENRHAFAVLTGAASNSTVKSGATRSSQWRGSDSRTKSSHERNNNCTSWFRLDYLGGILPSSDNDRNVSAVRLRPPLPEVKARLGSQSDSKLSGNIQQASYSSSNTS